MEQLPIYVVTVCGIDGVEQVYSFSSFENAQEQFTRKVNETLEWAQAEYDEDGVDIEEDPDAWRVGINEYAVELTITNLDAVESASQSVPT